MLGQRTSHLRREVSSELLMKRDKPTRLKSGMHALSGKHRLKLWNIMRDLT